MKEYKVVIEETIDEEFTVVAESEDDAFNKAVELYKNGVIVLDNAELTSRMISVANEIGQFDEFKSF